MNKRIELNYRRRIFVIDIENAIGLSLIHICASKEGIKQLDAAPQDPKLLNENEEGNR